MYKIRAHEVRDLLKSTLIASKCAQYAADHVLGHAPRDSYEKQATLYPEELRAEYAKASSRLNIFSKVESTLNTADDPESLQARIRELEAQAAGTVLPAPRLRSLKRGTGNPCRRCTMRSNPSRNKSVRSNDMMTSNT